MAHPARLFEGNFDHLLDARSRHDLLQDGEPLVSAEQGLQRLADLIDLDAEAVKDFGCYPICLSQQPEQDVLRADVAVVGPFRFFLCERQDLFGPLGEPLEREHVPQSLGPGARVGPAPPPLLELSRSAPAGLNPLSTYLCRRWCALLEYVSGPDQTPWRRPLYSRNSRSVCERDG